MEADLRMARDLQYAFLPSSYPVVTTGEPGNPGHLDFAHVYHPSGLVGGDFFDILPVSETQVLIFVADVMGHGARAALVVATIRGLLEQIAKETQEPGEFMTRLNSAYSKIYSNASELMVATACCVSFASIKGSRRTETAMTTPVYYRITKIPRSSPFYERPTRSASPVGRTAASPRPVPIRECR